MEQVILKALKGAKRTPLVKNPVVRNIARNLPVREMMDYLEYRQLKKKSETRLCRERLAPFCKGNGLDLGFGGDPITPNAIRMDMENPYAKYLNNEPQLKGDARDLYWFKDNTLDFIFSSHLLEDFPDTKEVLVEWLRVLKPGGRIVLYCPDQQKYVDHCISQGKKPNPYHSIDDFSLKYVQDILDELGMTKTIEAHPSREIYSFDLVAEKL